MPRASLHTLGCRLNQAETAIIAKTLSVRGYDIVEFGEPADLTVINTCTVTEQADAKCRQAVRHALRLNPQDLCRRRWLLLTDWAGSHQADQRG